MSLTLALMTEADPLMPQQLVRRNFLRFGKRSVPEDDSEDVFDSGTESDPSKEMYQTIVESGNPAGIHESSPRSFLRFGRSGGGSDNFLRFGKRSESSLSGCTSFGDGYFVICRLNHDAGMSRFKKARDFLRFG